MDLTKKVGNNIRLIRKSQKLTIDELAEKCNFKASYLSDIERGERNITLQTLSKILNALQVDPASVLIPEKKTSQSNLVIKEELFNILLSTLEDKDVTDIQMLLNISNEIFNRLSNTKTET